MEELSVVEQRIRSCQACSLWTIRSRAVPGLGPVDADIVIIGEAPGKNEDTHGKPFIGVSGKKLTKLLGAAGISRNDCYITNMVKCWPGDGNPDPEPEEIEACSPWLTTQLNLIKPKGVLTFGRFSTQRFFEFPPKMGITKLMGTMMKDWWDADHPYYVMPLLHPAARNMAEYEDEVVSHLQKFRDVVYNGR